MIATASSLDETDPLANLHHAREKLREAERMNLDHNLAALLDDALWHLTAAIDEMEGE